MPGNNPAQRMIGLMEKVPHVGPQEPMVHGLKTLFSYEPPDAYRGHAQRLEQVLVQIDLAEAGLRALQFPETLFLKEFSRARSAFTPSALNANFNHVRDHLTSDVLLAFKWAAFALPDEGEALKSERLQELTDQVAAQLKDNALQALPEGLRSFLTEHLTAILNALRGYSVAGVEPLQKAVKDFGVELVANRDAINTATASADDQAEPILSRTKALIRKVVETASLAGKGADGVEKVWKFAAERGPQLIDWAQ